jgi:hypothetical protein
VITALRQAQGPAKVKVIEPVEIEDSTKLNADLKKKRQKILASFFSIHYFCAF